MIVNYENIVDKSNFRCDANTVTTVRHAYGYEYYHQAKTNSDDSWIDKAGDKFQKVESNVYIDDTLVIHI